MSAGRRKSVAFLTLKEAADYARFACAAYAVFEYEDKDDKDDKGNPIEGHCANTCGVCKPKNDMKTYATVIRSDALPLCQLFALPFLRQD